MSPHLGLPNQLVVLLMRGNRYLVALGGIALALLLGGVISSFVSIRSIDRLIGDIQAATVALDRAELCLTNLLDAETSARGYAITGDSKFLEPYERVINRTRADCLAVAPLTEQAANTTGMMGLDQLIGERISHNTAVVDIRRSGNIAGTNALIVSGVGKDLSDKIRLLLGGYNTAKRSEFLAKQADIKLVMKDFIVLMVSMSSLALLLALAFVWLIVRDMRHQLADQININTQLTLDLQLRANESLALVNTSLLASEENLDITLDSIGDGLISTDVHGLVSRLNRAAEHLTGWRAEEAIGRPVAEIFCIVNKATRKPAVIPVANTLITGMVTGLANHTVLISRDGREYDIADSCAPIRNRDKSVAGAVLVFRDVTAEYKLQQTLTDTAARVQAVLTTAADGIVTFYAKGGVIESANTATLNMFGYTDTDIIGQSFSMLVPELGNDLHNGSLEYYVASVAGKASGLGREVTGRRHDGSSFAMEIAVNEFAIGGERFFTAMLRDNTIRKQVEAERSALDLALQNKSHEFEAATKLAEKANLAKSDFLSNMSHELRTPLGAILGFAQLLESATPAPSVAQSRSIGQILKAGWYLLDLINEILDLAQIESGRISMSLEPTALGKLLTDCQMMIEPQAALKDIKLSFPALAADLYVKADWTRLKQAIVNLLSNSIKYNRTGGTVTVHVYVGNTITREQNAASVGVQNQIRISVTDTGFGLSAEDMAKLFQPFNRLGQENGVEVGTGIGLVVCRQLLQHMGGRIGVDSEVGVGSTFWIEVPQSAAPMAHVGEIDRLNDDRANSADQPGKISTATTKQAPIVVPRFSMLYIEDNPANLMLVEDLMARRPDIRLLTAVNADIGIAIARATLPNVILMDINLPGINGMQAKQILAADPTTAHIPVMALSANAMPRDISRGLKAGFFRYLTKPIKVNEMMSALDEALKHNASDSDKDNDKDNAKVVSHDDY